MMTFALLVLISLQIYLMRLLVVAQEGTVILVVRLVPLSSIRLMKILMGFGLLLIVILFYCRQGLMYDQCMIRMGQEVAGFVIQGSIQIIMNRVSLLLLILIALAAVVADSRRLIYVQEIFRHGARYPIIPLANNNSNLTNSQNMNGELTSEGKHMQYLLGRAMYDRYWVPLFNGTPYLQKYHPSQIYVKSTNFNRTIESAQSQLQGLLENLPVNQLPAQQLKYSLPPYLNIEKYQEDIVNSSTFPVFGSTNTNFHTVPIHTEKELIVASTQRYKYRANPYDEGDFLLKFQANNCPNQVQWTKQNLASSEAMTIKTSQRVTTYLKALSSELGKQVGFSNAGGYYDDFECKLNLGKKHLDVFNNPDYRKTADFMLVSYMVLGTFNTQDQIRSSNTQLLKNTLYRMREAKAGRGPKLVLFSGHDTTILSVLTAFNMINPPCLMDNFFNSKPNQDICVTAYPQFAANIVLELWQEDNLSHSVKVLYNGVERKIPICGNQFSCPFADFESWANGFYLEDPNDTCGISEHYTKFYIVIGILSLFILVLVIIEMRRRFKKKIETKMQEMEEKKGYIENFEEKDGSL